MTGFNVDYCHQTPEKIRSCDALYTTTKINPIKLIKYGELVPTKKSKWRKIPTARKNIKWIGNVVRKSWNQRMIITLPEDDNEIQLQLKLRLHHEFMRMKRERNKWKKKFYVKCLWLYEFNTKFYVKCLWLCRRSKRKL